MNTTAITKKMTPIYIESASGTVPLSYLLDTARSMLRLCSNGQVAIVVIPSEKITLTIRLERVSVFEITETFTGKLNKFADEESSWPDVEQSN